MSSEPRVDDHSSTRQRSRRPRTATSRSGTTTAAVASLLSSDHTPTSSPTTVGSSSRAPPHPKRRFSEAFSDDSTSSSSTSFYSDEEEVVSSQENDPKQRHSSTKTDKNKHKNASSCKSKRKRKRLKSSSKSRKKLDDESESSSSSCKSSCSASSSGSSVCSSTIDDCCICMSKPGYREVSSLDGCSHQYCFTCIAKWAETENTCPLCKKRFTKIARVNPLTPQRDSHQPGTATTSSNTAGATPYDTSSNSIQVENRNQHRPAVRGGSGPPGWLDGIGSGITGGGVDEDDNNAVASAVGLALSLLHYMDGGESDEEAGMLSLQEELMRHLRRGEQQQEEERRQRTSSTNAVSRRGANQSTHHHRNHNMLLHPEPSDSSQAHSPRSLQSHLSPSSQRPGEGAASATTIVVGGGLRARQDTTSSSNHPDSQPFYPHHGSPSATTGGMTNDIRFLRGPGSVNSSGAFLTADLAVAAAAASAVQVSNYMVARQLHEEHGLSPLVASSIAAATHGSGIPVIASHHSTTAALVQYPTAPSFLPPVNVPTAREAMLSQYALVDDLHNAAVAHPSAMSPFHSHGTTAMHGQAAPSLLSGSFRSGGTLIPPAATGSIAAPTVNPAASYPFTSGTSMTTSLVPQPQMMTNLHPSVASPPHVGPASSLISQVMNSASPPSSLAGSPMNPPATAAASVGQPTPPPQQLGHYHLLPSGEWVMGSSVQYPNGNF